MGEIFEGETVLSDLSEVTMDTLYVADGNIYRCEWGEITVAELKQRKGFGEVRRCNIAARSSRP
ncbi:hypothetical protein ACVIGA_000012 [Bradyrhizobium sp. USDA 3240]